MNIERYNGNTLRRYRHSSGATLVVDRRQARVLPAWCNHVSKSVSRQEAADILRQMRAA